MSENSSVTHRSAETEALLATADRTNCPSYRPAPFVLDSGEGCRVRDIDGVEYLDFLAGIAVNALGYGNTAVAKAIALQAPKLMHISNMFVTKPQIDLLDKLTTLTFADRAYLCNSGAEANEAALKLARRYQTVVKGDEKRVEFVSMNKSFHGRTLGALTATGQPKYHKGFEPLIPGFSYADYNDLDSVQKLVTERTAAVILEPIQGEGGVRPATKEFLQGVREICDKKGALLIFDEVQTGMGRSGKWYAYMHYDVTPDILSSAKGLGSGFPIGAMLATKEVFEGFVPGSHATTYGGNPLACAASLAVIAEIEEKGLLANVSARHDQMMREFQRLVETYDAVKEARGVGLLCGLELEGELAAKVAQRLRDHHHVLVNVAGGNTIRFAPPFVITEEDVATLFEKLERAIVESAG